MTPALAVLPAKGGNGFFFSSMLPYDTGVGQGQFCFHALRLGSPVFSMTGSALLLCSGEGHVCGEG